MRVMIRALLPIEFLALDIKKKENTKKKKHIIVIPSKSKIYVNKNHIALI